LTLDTATGSLESTLSRVSHWDGSNPATSAITSQNQREKVFPPAIVVSLNLLVLLWPFGGVEVSSRLFTHVLAPKSAARVCCLSSPLWVWSISSLSPNHRRLVRNLFEIRDGCDDIP